MRFAVITRFEIIDDTKDGRVVIVEPDDNKIITFDVQDDGQTLKVFIGNKDEISS